MYKRHYRSNVSFHPIPDHAQYKKPNSEKNRFFLFDQLPALLPEGTDIGDIILLLLLLLLYIDSHDEEFLIMLLATGMSLFQQ